MAYIWNRIFDILVDVSMSNKSKSNDFLAGFDKIWQKGPEVKYKNPDGQHS